MNHPGGGGRFVPGMDGPGAGFHLAGGQVSAQAQQMIHGTDQGAHSAFVHAQIGQIRLRFIFGKIDQFAFDLRTDHHRFGGEVGAHVVLNGFHVFRRRLQFHDVPGRPAFLFLRRVDGRRDMAEIGLRHIAGEDSRFHGQEHEFARRLRFVVAERHRDGRFA